jgi:hypothetical protein
MDSIEIKQTVELIDKIINTEEYVILKNQDEIRYRNKLINLFPTFAQDYPILFKKIINREDLTMLYTMLKSLNDVSSGKDEKQITTELGEMLAEKYIYPVVGAPPIKEYR